MILISFLGAMAGLVTAILLILRKVQPVYALMAGAILGGLTGGASMQDTINCMFGGSKEMLPAVLRVLAAGVLAGVLMESGASVTIAEVIIKKTGEKRFLLALALSTFILTASGVFIYVSVITVAPIALALGSRTHTSKEAILLAMIGGGKSGNIISPNPNSIAVADNFKVELTSVMLAGIIPAVAGILITVILATAIRKKKGEMILDTEIHYEHKNLPCFWAAISGPLIAIVLLALKPTLGIKMDPIIALPVGGIGGAAIMGKLKHMNRFSAAGLEKTLGVAVLLLCTGSIAGIISNSTLKDIIIHGLQISRLPGFLLAPVSGIVMSAATASTTSGAAVASTVFGKTIVALGVRGLAAAAMINAGATVLDHLPHGSFFHASAGSVALSIRQRLKLIPYETLIGLFLTFVSILLYYISLNYFRYDIYSCSRFF